MTLKEAIGSGRPFRRKGWRFWLETGYVNAYQIPQQHIRTFTADDVMSEDWEIKPKKKKLYAYKEVDLGPGTIEGRIHWSEHSDECERVGLERAPEYDMEFGE